MGCDYFFNIHCRDVLALQSQEKNREIINSHPVISDANCTRICIYMSFVLLASSLIYELTGFTYADAIGTAGLIYFSISEGREAFEKAQGKNCDCCD